MASDTSSNISLSHAFESARIDWQSVLKLENRYRIDSWNRKRYPVLVNQQTLFRNYLSIVDTRNEYIHKHLILTCWQNKLHEKQNSTIHVQKLNHWTRSNLCTIVVSECKWLYASVTCVLCGNNLLCPFCIAAYAKSIIFLELLVMMFHWRPSGSAPFVSAYFALTWARTRTQTQCIVFVTIHPHSSVWYPFLPSLALSIFLCLLSFH